MSDFTQRWAWWPIILLTVILPPIAAQAEGDSRATAAVVVEAPEGSDAALAHQIESLLTATLEDRGIDRIHFGREDVSAREDEIRKGINEAFNRVTAGMRSKPFDEGNEILNRAFFQAKQILGRIDPALLARLYKAFAAAQITLGKKELGEDYVAACLNLDREQSPRSFHYFSAMRWVVDVAHKRVDGPKIDVTIDAVPPEARILVDGKDLGPPPVKIKLGGGPHLVQVRADGYHPQGWLKDSTTGTRWNIKLRPLPAWSRYTTLRRNSVAGLRLDEAARRAVAAGGEPPAPVCPTAALAALGRLVVAEHILLASVESLGDRIAVRGCHGVGGTVTSFSLLLQRDASLLGHIREAIEDALARGRTAAAAAARPPSADRIRKGAQDPMLARLAATRRAVEKQLAGIAGRERGYSAIGLAAGNARFLVVRGPLEGLLVDLDEAARVYPTDKVQCGRLVRGAEDRLRRMRDMLLSVDTWDPTPKAQARDEAAVRTDHATAQQDVDSARGRWKAARRKVKDRALKKRLDRKLNALRKELKGLSRELQRADDVRPLAGKTLQLVVDAKGFLRAVDAALEPPPPPPLVPEVEPEPEPAVSDPSREPEPESAVSDPSREPVEDLSKLVERSRATVDPVPEPVFEPMVEPEPEPEPEPNDTLF